MSEHLNESGNKKTALAEYVNVAIAEDMELAKEYQDVLNNSGISAVLRTQRTDNAEILGVAVMVPEDSCEQAITVIEAQQAFDDFLDVAFNDDDDGNDYFDDIDFEDDDDDF